MFDILNIDSRSEEAQKINEDLYKNNKKLLTIYDPPYNEWNEAPTFKSHSVIAFCSHQSRHEAEKKLGKPRTELVWFFKDGRWVSNYLPRITHNYIYVYGETDLASVGEKQSTKPQKKGKGSIGQDKSLGDRIYYPKPYKQLNSVLCYSRNMKSGYWSKPEKMINQLIRWVQPDAVLDPFASYGSIGSVCLDLKINYIGFEIDKNIVGIAQSRFKAHRTKSYVL
tara:strand:+ start:26 stop:697 length:672 start_codon:yes stop_codon:yes gene_type:complete